MPDSEPAVTQAVLEEFDDGRFLWGLAEKTGVASEISDALWVLESALCEAVIRSQKRFIAVHAGTLVSGDTAVLLVGPADAGKSTLSVAMGRRGFRVATDDVALVNPDTLNVLPIPRCFHLDRQSVTLLEADGMQLPEVWKRLSFVTPVDLADAPIPRCRAGLLIYVMGPRAASPRISPISQSEMAARLLSETGQGPLSDLETVAVLSRMSGAASCFQLVPGPLTATADAVADLIRHELRL